MSQPRSKSANNSKRQAGKTVVLSALIIVLLVMVVRHLAGGDGPPATASAQPHGATSASSVKRAAAAGEVVRLAKTTDLARDLFVFDGQAYERLDDDQPAVTESGPSVSSQTKALVDEARQALNVQATAGGEAPRALINGQWHNVGDKIAGFTLVEVETRSIVVQRGGIRVRLNM